MNIEKLKADLDQEKAKYNDAKEKIEELRLEIANSLCPLKVGERVKFSKGGKEYEGLVEHIHYAIDTMDGLFPKIGAETGWSASGRRVNKTTGEVGNVSFSVSSLDFELQSGIWVQKPPLENFFGL